MDVSCCPSKKPMELRTSVQRRERVLRQISAIPGSPSWIMRCAALASRAVGGECLGKMFAAVIEGASQGEFAVTTDQNRALQMTEIEQEESFFLVNFRISNFERVERTNLR